MNNQRLKKKIYQDNGESGKKVFNGQQFIEIAQFL